MNEHEIYKKVCESNLQFFLQQAFKVLHPELNYEHNWHIDVMCDHLTAVKDGRIRNLDINISPRTIKSELVNIVFPAWVWTTWPSAKFITGCYAASLSIGFNIKRRLLIKSDWYQSYWPTKIREDRDTTGIFENTSNGFMRATSTGGSITGDGADFLIGDDLIDVQDAFSKTAREHARFWFENTFYNRVNDAVSGRRINVNQRLHENDISGLIEEKFKDLDDWEKLVIQMQKTDLDINTSLNWKDPRKKGEFMHPKRFGLKQAKVHQADSYKWSSQYQQSPTPIGGGIIKEEWIRYYDVLPKKFDKVIISGDLTFKGNKTSDYVCFQCWGKLGIYKYLIDIVRGQWTYKITKEKFKMFCEKNSLASKKYIEDKANGPALISDLKEIIPGLESWPTKSSKLPSNIDKVQRVHLVSSEYEDGLVLLPKDNPLVEKFKFEVTSFTEKGSTTGNDDMVDTSTTALIELKNSGRSKFSAGKAI